MALTTFTAGTPILSAAVNANFLAMDRTGYASATAIGNVGSGEDTLHSWTIPGGTLSAVGDGLQIRTVFYFEANANAKTVQFYIGSSYPSFPYAMNSTAAPNNKSLYVDLTVFVVSTGASNNFSVIGTPVLSNLGGTSPAFESTLLSPTTSISAGSLGSDLVLKFTGSATTTNDIVQKLIVITLFKAA
jgi:hypothetical protein